MRYTIYRLNKCKQENIHESTNKNNTNEKLFERGDELKNIMSINWQDNIENVFISFDFETTEILSENDWIEVYSETDNQTIFYGEITDTSVSHNDVYKYQGYDYGRSFLNKRVTIQYNEASIKDAIEKLCSRKEINYTHTLVLTCYILYNDNG